MAHAYQSLEPGEQIIISDEPREDLEALARWVSVDVPDVPDVPDGPTDEEKAAAELEAAGIAAAEVEAAAKAAVDLAGTAAPTEVATDARDIEDDTAKTTKGRGK
jgi:hypothetical protein